MDSGGGEADGVAVSCANAGAVTSDSAMTTIGIKYAR
jgi:hypothetical protein